MTVKEPVEVVARRDDVASAGRTGANPPALVSPGMAAAERRGLLDAEGVGAGVQDVAAVRGRA